MPVTLFRTLVLLSWGYYLLYMHLNYVLAAVPNFALNYFMWLDAYDARGFELLSGRGHAALLNMGMVGYGGFLLLWTAAAAGMVLLKNWGRYFYAITAAVAAAATAVGGIVVNTPFEATLVGIAYMCDGAVLGAAFFSPLAERFGEAPV